MRLQLLGWWKAVVVQKWELWEVAPGVEVQWLEVSGRGMGPVWGRRDLPENWSSILAGARLGSDWRLCLSSQQQKCFEDYSESWF